MNGRVQGSESSQQSELGKSASERLGRAVTSRRRWVYGIVLPSLILFVGGCGLGKPGPQPGAEGIGDGYAPLMGNGGYDVQVYDLDLEWDNVTNVLSGTATVDAIATMDLSAFNLDFYGSEIQALAVNDVPSAFSREGQELTITPREAIRADDAFIVTIGYHGVPEVWPDRSRSV